jgi:hypothetical protein
MSQEDDSDETESRANRLIDRRGRSRERTRSDTETETETDTENENDQTGQTGQTGQAEQDGQDQTRDSTQSAQSGESESDDEGGVWSETGSENVKRENTALYMYLDQRLHDAVIDVFEDVRYRYRKAYDVELEKNRHVYPLILEHGIEPVREMSESPAEVRDALDANPYTPVPAEVTADG